MVRTQSLRISNLSDKTSIFHPKTCVAFRDKKKKSVEQQYKSGKLFIGYSKRIVLQIILQLENTVNC